MGRGRRVAVIGAGAGGLVAARTFLEAGCFEEVRVFEKSARVGGIWQRGGSVVYDGLRSNLPHQVMAFRGVPFDAPRSFVTTAEITEYLEAYAAGLPVEFGQEVTRCARDAEGGGDWVVETAGGGGGRFDFVVVANGHYERPARCGFPPEAVARFGGAVVHSADYFEPSAFAGEAVVLVGARSSGTDIAREILDAGARRVVVADRACPAREAFPSDSRLVRCPPIAELGREPGRVDFADGTFETGVGTVMECVGFDYDFPFLDPALLRAEPGSRAVEPLWEHAFHVEDPTLVFLGVPHSIVPFPLMQIQSILAARVFAGEVHLPDAEQRRADLAKHKQALKRPKDAHHLGDRQWDYCIRLIERAGLSDAETEAWRTHVETNRAMYSHLGKRRPAFPGAPDTYRSLEYVADHQQGTWACLNEQVLMEGAEVRAEVPCD